MKPFLARKASLATPCHSRSPGPGWAKIQRWLGSGPLRERFQGRRCMLSALFGLVLVAPQRRASEV